MNEVEFKRQYGRLAGAFNGIQGDRPIEHYQLWLERFGLWACPDFADAVTLVIDSHSSMGSDKWPTIGDFNRIVSTAPRDEESAGSLFRDDNEREYRQIQWRIRQLPITKRNELRRRVTDAVTHKEVPDYLKPVCDMEGIILDALIFNLEVRYYCQEKGIRCPVQ